MRGLHESETSKSNKSDHVRKDQRCSRDGQGRASGMDEEGVHGMDEEGVQGMDEEGVHGMDKEEV